MKRNVSLILKRCTTVPLSIIPQFVYTWCQKSLLAKQSIGTSYVEGPFHQGGLYDTSFFFKGRFPLFLICQQVGKNVKSKIEIMQPHQTLRDYLFFFRKGRKITSKTNDMNRPNVGCSDSLITMLCCIRKYKGDSWFSVNMRFCGAL